MICDDTSSGEMEYIITEEEGRLKSVATKEEEPMYQYSLNMLRR